MRTANQWGLSLRVIEQDTVASEAEALNKP